MVRFLAEKQATSCGEINCSSSMTYRMYITHPTNESYASLRVIVQAAFGINHSSFRRNGTVVLSKES